MDMETRVLLEYYWRTHTVSLSCVGPSGQSAMTFMTLRILLMVLSLSAVRPATRHLQNLPKDAVQRLNWGANFQPSDRVHLVTHHWGHTLPIKLPALHDRDISPVVHCSHGHWPVTAALNCTAARPIVIELDKFQRDSSARLNKIISHIYDLFPIRPRSQARRTARAWFGIVGQISKSLFGTATQKDVHVLHHAIARIQRQGVDAIDQFEKTTHAFASIMKLSNARLDNLAELQQEQHKSLTAIYQELLSEVSEVAVLSDMLAYTIGKFTKFLIIENDLQSLEHSLELLTQGLLSPVLVPALEMIKIFTEVRREVAIHDPTHFVALTDTNIYNQPDFITVRENDILLLHLKIPIANHREPCVVYKTMTFPVPTPDISNLHYTLINDLPWGLCYNSDLNFYVVFPTQPKIVTHLIQISHSDAVIIPRNSSTCILALFLDNRELVHSLCKFNLQVNDIIPTVIKIDYAHVLLTNIANATIQHQGQDDRLIDYCRQCQIKLACQDSLTTSIAIIPPRFAHCYFRRENSTVLQTVNLAVLRHWFDPIDLRRFGGQSLLVAKLNASYPAFKVFNNTEYLTRIATDHRYALDLTKAVQITKQDGTLFHDLAHSIQNDLDMEEISNYDTIHEIVSYSWPGLTLLIAAIALAWAVYLHWRTRQLAALVTIIQSLPRTNAIHTPTPYILTHVITPPRLYYRGTSPAPLENFAAQGNDTLGSALLTEQFNHLSYSIWLAIAIIFTVIIFAFMIHRSLTRRSRQGGIFLMFTLKQAYSEIKLQSLWFEPDLFDVKIRGFMKLEITRTIWGYNLIVEGDNPDVVNLVTGETMLLATRAYVTAWKARRLQKLLEQKCHVIILTRWGNHLQMVRLLRNLSQTIIPPSAPREDSYSHSLSGHPHQLGQQKEMVPQNSNLYPSHALRDIQVELIRQQNSDTQLPVFDRHVKIRKTLT
jgi:hypothetical protein